jgi:hypothetical protein
MNMESLKSSINRKNYFILIFILAGILLIFGDQEAYKNEIFTFALLFGGGCLILYELLFSVTSRIGLIELNIKENPRDRALAKLMLLLLWGFVLVEYSGFFN